MRHRVVSPCVIVASLVFACGVQLSLSGCAPSDGGETALEQTQRPIYNGTRAPQNVSLTPGQMLAIGWVHTAGDPGDNFCSGTVIAPRVVATAAHCFLESDTAATVGFGVGLYPSQPEASFDVGELVIHPAVDAALLLLTEDVTQVVPGLQPIPANDLSPTALLGSDLDAAGYGETNDGSTGRYFASVRFENIEGSLLVTNGLGQQGICFGDSGGPLLGVLGGQVVVLAVESEGEEGCLYRDWQTRLDTLADWLDDYVVDTSDTGCGSVTYTGQCIGDVVQWCEGGQAWHYDCSDGGLTCGFMTGELIYGCVEAGLPTQQPQWSDGNGGCRAAPSAVPPVWAAVLLLAWLWRRRQ